MSQDAALANELLHLAQAIATKAGEMLMQRPADMNINQKSSARDFATQMDHASEALIVKEILAARPDDGIIGEEDSTIASRSGITWVIDPIDGTVNYFYDLPGWNISIAAKDKDGVLMGLVHAPTINSTWHAIRGGGAFKNGRPIRVNDPVELGSALLGTGFSYDTGRRTEQAAFISGLIPRVRDIRRFGAAAVDLCHVASGTFDGYFERDLKEWDLAAGTLICREAGGVVTGATVGPDGQLGEPGEAMTIAAGSALHASLLAAIRGAD
jgi:myo-inositol-1(or 4)-monophosphatase